MNFNQPISFKYNVDEDGEPYSIVINNEVKQISPSNYCIQLNQIPDEFHRLTVRYNGTILHEVFDIEDLNEDGYRVNYNSGLVFFNSVLKGKNVTIDYYGRGFELIHADRVILSNGNSLDNIIFNKEKEFKVEKLWRFKCNNPVYSTPIVSKFSSNGRLVVSFQSWDWKSYVLDLKTGEELFSRFFSRELYGRPQAQDVNGDGKTEFFFASHGGEIRCYNEDNVLLWEQFDEYERQGVGAVSEYVVENGIAYISDNTKQWADGLYTRNKNQPSENSEIGITDGTGKDQWFRIKEVKDNRIELYEPLTTPLDNTSKYKVYPVFDSDKMFQHAGTLSEENGKWYLYTTGFDFVCRKIDATNGNVIWTHSTKEHIEPFPLITDFKLGRKKCIFVSVDWYVYCVDCETGVLDWKIATENGNDAFLTTLDLSTGEQVIVVSSRDSRVYLIKSDGSIHAKTTVTHGDIDSCAVVGDFNNDGKQEFIFGGDAGFVYCCNENAETLWRKRIGVYINSSSIKADVNYDGNEEVLVSDMNGTITVFNPLNGNVVGEIHCQGSVEGTPCIGDFDDDGNIEMIVTTVDGYVEMYRFVK